MSDKPYQSVEILMFGAGMIIESADVTLAIRAALDDQRESGARVHLISGHVPVFGPPFYTYILIDGVVYQLDKTDWQEEASDAD